MINVYQILTERFCYSMWPCPMCLIMEEFHYYRYAVSIPFAASHSIGGPFAGPGQFTIISVTIGTDHEFISVTFVQVSHVRL